MALKKITQNPTISNLKKDQIFTRLRIITARLKVSREIQKRRKIKKKIRSRTLSLGTRSVPSFKRNEKREKKKPNQSIHPSARLRNAVCFKIENEKS